MLTLQEIQQLEKKNLLNEIDSARKELFKVKFNVRTGQSKEVHLIKKWKKYIARLKTVEKSVNNEVTKEEKSTIKKETAVQKKRKTAKSTKKTVKK